MCGPVSVVTLSRNASCDSPGEAMCQTVLVTGASSGIGQAIAPLLAERGFKIFGTARKPAAATSGNVTMVPLDVRSDDSVRACIERVGPIDVLVNNAGYAL